MITLRFEGDEGTTRYEICTQAILLTQKTVQLGEYDDVISLLKKLKGIGHPAKERVGSIVLYDLGEDGGSIDLERSESNALVDFIKQPMWRPPVLEDVRGTIQWIEAASKKPKLEKANAE